MPEHEPNFASPSAVTGDARGSVRPYTGLAATQLGNHSKEVT